MSDSKPDMREIVKRHLAERATAVGLPPDAPIHDVMGAERQAELANARYEFGQRLLNRRFGRTPSLKELQREKENVDQLYHGSCKPIEGAFVPRLQDGDINGPFPEGKKEVLFATDDRELAAIYTLKNQYMLGTGQSNRIKFAVIRDHDAWEKEIANSACNLYVLPRETFKNTLSNIDGSPTVEWQSECAVNPIKSVRQTPESVMQQGAQLFFLDPKVTGGMWHYQPGESADHSFLNRIEAKKVAGILPESFSMLDIAKVLIDAGIMRHLNAETKTVAFEFKKSPYAEVIKDDVEWLKQQMLAQPEPQRSDGKSWTAATGERTGWVKG